MNDFKKIISISGTLILAVTSAWIAASLFEMLFYASVPGAVWFSAVLAIEAGAGWYALRFRRKHISAKMVLGVVFCVSLVLSLGAGLFSAVSYFAQYLENGYLFTSFPWYAGFAFSVMVMGPVIVLSGVGWMILHLRENPRNVRDLRLLVFLLLMGTGVWAVLWTANRIRLEILYPDHTAYPWHASIFFGLLYFGPWLLAEGAALVLLKRRERKLEGEGAFASEPAPPAPPVPVPENRKPERLLWDLGIVTMPLLAVSVLMAWVSDTGYLAYQIATVTGNAAAVCLVLSIAAWLVNHHFQDPGKLKQLRWLTGLLMLLTAGAMVCWIFWYGHRELQGPTGLPEDARFRFGIAYFGPFLLGQAISWALIYRMGRRAASGARENASPAWRALPAVLLVLLPVMLWGLLNQMEYPYEVEAAVSSVTVSEGGHIDLTLEAAVHVDGIFDSRELRDGDGIYLQYATRWTPFGEIEQFHWHHTLYPDADVTQIYLYEQPGVYSLEVIKDPQTGEWQLADAAPVTSPGPSR